jgi:guanosine-3',5'-bis(diphosphate) 3'-pyrophosphohydrolase
MKYEVFSRDELEAADGLFAIVRKLPLVDKALTVATTAHAAIDQRRKYDGAPYIGHPVMVAKIALLAGASPDMVAAALLHDVVEDTQVTEADLRALFPDTVVDLVIELTEPDDPDHWAKSPYGKRPVRSIRRALEAERRVGVSMGAQTLTVCDAIANAHDIVGKADDAFARVYITELKTRVEKLARANALLKARALRLFEEQLTDLAAKAA